MREIIVYGLVGFLFCFFQITGYDLAGQGNIQWSASYTVRVILESAAGGAAFGWFWHIATGIGRSLRMRLVADGSGETQPGCGETQIEREMTQAECGETQAGHVETQPGRGETQPEREMTQREAWQIWLVSFCLIVLCWLPCYLAYYPGICAYDTTIQTGQIVDGMYNDHHPIAHTLLIAGSMKLGQAVFGDANDGIGLLVFVQMVMLAAVFAWGVSLLWKSGKKGSETGRLPNGILVCIQLFGMLYPFHMYMSVSLIKDVFFSIFFLLQLLSLCEMLRRRNVRMDRFDGLYLVGAVGMQLFRNNGRYALLVLLVILLLMLVFGKKERKFWAKLAGGSALALFIGTLCLSGLFRLTQAQQGDRREMLSMPIQQLARCMLYHGGVGELKEDDGTMDAQSVALVNDFLLDESYRLYRPEISDPVKSHTNTYVVRYRAMNFLRTYLHLLASYPGDFINAALAVNAGYLYVGDVSHAMVNKNGMDRGLGYVQTRWVESELNPRGIYKASKWEWLHERLEEWADTNAYLRLPLLKYLFVPGTCLWLYLLLGGTLIVRRDYGGCIPLSLVLGYYLTLFFGPTVQLRYLYPLMLTLPFLAALLLGRRHTISDISKMD